LVKVDIENEEKRGVINEDLNQNRKKINYSLENRCTHHL